MENIWKTSLWRQFGAAIDLLANAIQACPEPLWRARLWEVADGDPAESAEFWYLIFHTLFWLDLYLTGAVEGFTPPPPFTLDELDPTGLVPEKIYTKNDLQAYLEYGRDKCRDVVESLTVEKASHACRFRWGEISYGELLLYSLRHVQEHAAQLSMLLGQQAGSAPGWVTRAVSA